MTLTAGSGRPSDSLTGRLRERLEEIEHKGLTRRRRVMSSPQGVDITVDGRRLVNFCGNDYLGLANHPRVVQALIRGASDYGAGAGAAHLVCGHGRAHHELEEALAAFVGRDRALLFSTGYMANLGVVAALCGPGDRVFEDRLNHASLIDGARLSDARLQRYRHADPTQVEGWLERAVDGTALIASDGVFSMDGDLAPVGELAELARARAAWLMIDDAHGLGVLGATGGGVLEQAGLTQDDVPILVGTLGKAFGTFGAFVAGSSELIEYLIQRARTYIYTTALPPAVAVATRTALDLVREETWRRERLMHLIRRFRQGARQLGLDLLDSVTPIQPVLVGDNRTALTASAGLEAKGFLVAAIRPPTVPLGTARLRVTLTAAHTETQVDRLLEALAAQPGLCGDVCDSRPTAVNVAAS
jgi:8-amino-7-oxononanoate synthase